MSVVAAAGAVSLKLTACAEPFVSYTTMNPPLEVKKWCHSYKGICWMCNSIYGVVSRILAHVSRTLTYSQQKRRMLGMLIWWKPLQTNLSSTLYNFPATLQSTERLAISCSAVFPPLDKFSFVLVFTLA